MKKQLQITVAKPCHENWDKMSKTEQGKFCGSCQKQVVDFSSMSDRQLAAFFKKPSNGSLCGRFMSDQLDRSIDIPKKRIPWLKYFFSMLMPAFIISKVSAQTKIMGKVARPVRDTTKTCISDERRTMGIVAPGIEPFQKEFIVKGKIVDENGEPIPFVAIEAGKTMFRIHFKVSRSTSLDRFELLFCDAIFRMPKRSILPGLDLYEMQKLSFSGYHIDLIFVKRPVAVKNRKAILHQPLRSQFFSFISKVIMHGHDLSLYQFTSSGKRFLFH